MKALLLFVAACVTLGAWRRRGNGVTVLALLSLVVMAALYSYAIS